MRLVGERASRCHVLRQHVPDVREDLTVMHVRAREFVAKNDESVHLDRSVHFDPILHQSQDELIMRFIIQYNTSVVYLARMCINHYGSGPRRQKTYC